MDDFTEKENETETFVERPSEVVQCYTGIPSGLKEVFQILKMLSSGTEYFEKKGETNVNHVLSHSDGGFWEGRFVQRTPERFICYLSSHTGCAHSCRFCHLTATKQTMMTPASLEDYLNQAKHVLKTYEKNLDSGKEPAQLIHFNFMARGDALSNPYFVNNSQELYDNLTKLVEPFNLDIKFLISTIFPNDFNGNLDDIFKDERAIPYYSLYSMNPQFRKNGFQNLGLQKKH